MKCPVKCAIAMAAFCLAFPPSSPAPLIYQPGEGWTYQGSSDIMDNPKDQIELGQKYESKRNYDDAIAAYLYLLRKWPNSFSAQDAQYRIGICREELGYHYGAFKAYQRCVTKWPSHERFAEILERQYKIGNRFLSGERHKIWRVRTMPSMDKAIEIFETVVRNGPQSQWAPQAQFNIGLAREKQRAYEEAVAAYQKVIDKFPDHSLCEDAYYQMGAAYARSAYRADYDKSAANKAADAFEEYIARYPQGQKVANARKELEKLHTEQARGIYEIARFYEKQNKPRAALVYYNDLIVRFPESRYASVAKVRVERATRETTN